MKLKVEAILSFEGVRKGDVAELEETDRLRALISAGYLKVVGYGESEDRPRSNPRRKSRSRDSGADGRSPAGDEPSEDSGSGGHGETESVDQV